MLWFIRPTRWLAKALLAADTPRQIALGFSFGAVVGIVPKANLTAFVLAFILCASRVNLAMGLVGTLLFSWVGLLAEPLSHRIGWVVLSQPSLNSMWTTLMDLPFFPWTRLNNTVVLGSLILGLALVYPVYRVMRSLVARYQPTLAEYIVRTRIAKLLMSADLATREGIR